jgi:hypothetical protein
MNPRSDGHWSSKQKRRGAMQNSKLTIRNLFIATANPIFRKSKRSQFSKTAAEQLITMLSLAFFTLASIVMTVHPGIVAGEIAHMVVFNDNKEVTGLFCTDAEKQLMHDAMAAAAAAARVRRLGGKGQRGLKGATQTSRRTQTCTPGCGKYCGAAGTGCPSGKGGRRLAEEKMSGSTNKMSAHKSRELLTRAECEAKIPAVNAALNVLQASLNTPCKTVMGLKRNITCQEFSMDCSISYINLVNATSDTIMVANVSNSVTFCKSSYVTWQASTAFFQGSVNFFLTGPNGYMSNRTEDKAPYFMYGNKGADADGKLYPTGNFTLTVKSQYDQARPKTILFRAENC